jgi:hypothetical protein
VRDHTAEDQGPGRKYTPYAVCVLNVGRKDVIHDSHAVSTLHQHTKILSHADIVEVLDGADVEMLYSATGRVKSDSGTTVPGLARQSLE